MVAAKTQATENMTINSIYHSLEKIRKKRMLNASVSLNVHENKRHKKPAFRKIAPNLECYRKISYLSARTLNVDERKGESHLNRPGKTNELM